MAIPKECKMPDLSALEYPLVSRLLLQEVFLRKHGFSHEAKLYRRHFVRLLDKALNEYTIAREACLAQIEEAKRPVKELESGRIIYTFEFIDHIENCINAVARLSKFLQRLKSVKTPAGIPRVARRLLETRRGSIKDIRDTVEHVEEKIHNGETSPDKLIMLSLNDENDGVAILDDEIKFSSLAIILRRMHEIALHLLNPKAQVVNS
jgi:hypothetical protein